MSKRDRIEIAVFVMKVSNIKWKVEQLKKDGMTIKDIQDFALKQMEKSNTTDSQIFWQNVHNNVYIHY